MGGKLRAESGRLTSRSEFVLVDSGVARPSSFDSIRLRVLNTILMEISFLICPVSHLHHELFVLRLYSLRRLALLVGAFNPQTPAQAARHVLIAPRLLQSTSFASLSGNKISLPFGRAGVVILGIVAFGVSVGSFVSRRHRGVCFFHICSSHVNSISWSGSEYGSSGYGK